MTKEPRRTILSPPQTPWERMLENPANTDRTRAGEFEAGNEDGGGGALGMDADTGDGGYGGDAALTGHDEAVAQPDRPLDRQIEGDPRAYEGEDSDDAITVEDEEELGALDPDPEDDELAEDDDDEDDEDDDEDEDDEA